jgi:hypothetical protein
MGCLTLGAATTRGGLIANVPASADATLLGGSDIGNSLAVPGIFVGKDPGNVKRGLIEFDVAAAVPAGATIASVTLTLTVGQVAGSSGGTVVNSGPVQTMSLYDEAQAWGEPTNTVGATSFGGHGHGAAAATGDATWNTAFWSATAWNVAPGGNWTASSVDLADALVPGTTGYVASWSSPALIAEVQNWLDTPASNNGLLVKDQDELTATTFRAFWGAQGAINAGTPSWVPNLAIIYVVPEPGSCALLILGISVLARRRRARVGR